MNQDFLDQIRLRDGGGGGDPRDGLCVMELASWLEGADIVTDHPGSACPVLTGFAIALNDAAPSQRTRNKLTPLAPILVGSRDDEAVLRRERFIHEAMARDVLPLLLRQAGYEDEVATLRNARTEEARREFAAYFLEKVSADKKSTCALVRVAEALNEDVSAGLPELVLSRLDELCGDGADTRLRRLVWRKLASMLERALHLGKHGEPDDPRIAERLAALEARMAEHRTIEARKPMPTWITAIMSPTAAMVATGVAAALKLEPVES